MKEGISMEIDKMNEEQLVSFVKKIYIAELEKALDIYGPKWVNRQNCVELIDDLKNDRPTKYISGPFWGDILDGILYERGIRRSDGTGKYENVWQEIENGTVKK